MRGIHMKHICFAYPPLGLGTYLLIRDRDTLVVHVVAVLVQLIKDLAGRLHVAGADLKHKVKGREVVVLVSHQDLALV